MSAPGKLLAWLCAGIVAMPLSPCAFLMDACHARAHQAASAKAAALAGSCCAKNRERPADRPAREAPCRGDCCRVVPLVPSVEKPASQLPAPALAAGLADSHDFASGPLLPVEGSAGRPHSLHVLHCQWRC